VRGIESDYANGNADAMGMGGDFLGGRESKTASQQRKTTRHAPHKYLQNVSNNSRPDGY